MEELPTKLNLKNEVHSFFTAHLSITTGVQTLPCGGEAIKPGVAALRELRELIR